jgi:serine/threonine-protein kinase SRPK3
MSMLDHFQLDGPNGTHDCLVLELLGPSVADLLATQFHGERLPGSLAKSIAKQALLGLDYLHLHQIGHGGKASIFLLFKQLRSCLLDMYTRNLASTIPALHLLRKDEFFQKLGNPEIGLLRRKDGGKLEPGMPKYLVRPTSYPENTSLSLHPIKIIDFGESFLNNDMPVTLHMPLPIRAPEVIFGAKLDFRVDLWSMGCTVSLHLDEISISDEHQVRRNVTRN